MSKIQEAGSDPDREKFRVTIELAEERYFEGERVS